MARGRTLHWTMKNAPVCFGTGLVALDVILNGSPATLPKLSAGGSCGNVLSILSYLNWSAYPVARLANDRAGAELVLDMTRWGVNQEFLSQTEDGSTPIIIHRILKDKNGLPIHKFEFKDPETKGWLPQFKPITKNVAAEVMHSDLIPQVLYFDRMNPGTFELVKYYKAKGSVIFFEPTSAKDEELFEKFLALADVVKYSHERIPEFRVKHPSITSFLEIETLGKEGLVFRCKNRTKPNQWKEAKGFDIEKVQDAAGAGDWCSAGLITRLCINGYKGLSSSSDDDVEKAISFGQSLGALNCLYDGARGLMYYIESKKLVKAVASVEMSKSISSLKLPTTPIIDISSNLRFAKLYSKK